MGSAIYHELDKILFELGSDIEFSNERELLVENEGRNYILAILDADKIVFDYDRIDSHILDKVSSLIRILDSNKVSYTEINKH